MTPRTITTIDFREITSIEIRCKCGAIVTLPLPKFGLQDGLACPGCHEVLWRINVAIGGPTEGGSEVMNLMRSISDWQQVQRAPFTLQFSLVTSDHASDKRA